MRVTVLYTHILCPFMGFGCFLLAVLLLVGLFVCLHGGFWWGFFLVVAGKGQLCGGVFCLGGCFIFKIKDVIG